MSAEEETNPPSGAPPEPALEQAPEAAEQGGQTAQMATLLTTLTNTIGTVARALVAIEQRLLPTSTSTSLSHLTNIYDGHINLDTRAGRSTFESLQTLPSDWKSVSISLDHEEDIVRLFELKEKSHGFYKILHVPTSGTGSPRSNPRSLITGEDVYNADLGDHLSMIGDFPNLTLDHILAWDAYIYGDVYAPLQQLAPGVPRVAKLLDRTAAGNLGLIANFKHEIRIRSQLLLLIIQQAFLPSSLQTFFVDKTTLEWQDEVGGKTIVSGLVLLWRILESIMPNSVVDTSKLEGTIEKTMLIPDANNNVRTLFGITNSALEKLRKKNGTACYDDKRYITALFKALLTSKNEVFLNYIQQLDLKWTTNPSTLTPRLLMEDTVAIFDNMLQKGEWDTAPASNSDAQTMTLLTKEVRKLRKQVQQSEQSNSSDGKSRSTEKGKSTPGSKTMADNITPSARLKKSSEFKEIDGKSYQWCPKHIAKDGSFSGLYMACNSSCGKLHDHEKWLENKTKRQNRAEKGQKTKSSDSTPSVPNPKRLKPDQTMAHSFLTFMADRGHSHADTQAFLDTFVEGSLDNSNSQDSDD